MSKRLRSDSPETASDEFECPVCLTVKNPIFPFNCGHGVCDSCDSELFCRADDRCPTCRSSRLQESVQERLGSSGMAQRRQDAIAQREANNSMSGMIFFPSEGIIEVNMSQFIVREDDEVEPHREEPRPSVSIMNDNRVRDAVGALINAERTPLGEFFVAVAALRSAFPRRSGRSQVRMNAR